MSKKKSLSLTLDREALKKAQPKIDLYFSGNRSAYINFLIVKDSENQTIDNTENKGNTISKKTDSKKISTIDTWDSLGNDD